MYDLQLEDLAESYNTGDLCLVLGAGFSASCEFPDWFDLLSEMYKSTSQISKSSQNLPYDLVQKAFGASANTIMGKFFSRTHGKNFPDIVRECLYPKNAISSDLVDSVKRLTAYPKGGGGLDSIVTFNFDDILEMSLDPSCYFVVHDEGMRCPSNKLGIYHVHGYIPRVRDPKVRSNIVFSEDSYHIQYGDPFSWSNHVQLARYIFKNCLFVGVSLNDPNLRRLLDLAITRKMQGSNGVPADRFHYAILKRPGGPSAQAVTHLKEYDAIQLGIKILWVDEYSDIPPLLDRIKI